MAKQINTTSFDKNTAKLVTELMLEALKSVEQKLGVKIVSKGGRFGSMSMESKFEVRLAGAEASAWNKYCGMFGLEPKHCGTKFTSKKWGPATMVNIQPRRTRFPIECLGDDGKVFLIPAETAKFHIMLAANAKSKKLVGSSARKPAPVVEDADIAIDADEAPAKRTRKPKADAKAPARKPRKPVAAKAESKSTTRSTRSTRGRPKVEGSRAERRAARAAAKAAAEKKDSRSTARKPKVEAKPVATKRSVTKRAAAKAAPKSAKTNRRRRSAV